MGVAIYPVFEDESGGGTDDIDGKLLAKACNQLDKACKKASLPTLHDFFSMDREQMIAECLDGDPDDPSTYDESQLPPEHWHDPQEGQRTVEFLIEYVESGSGQIEKRDWVLEALREFARLLSAASDKGVRWHLGMDY